MTIHDQILKELNLQPGDKVQITHKVPDFNLGWMNSWTKAMDSYIGKTDIVASAWSGGVELKNCGAYHYPAQCLKVVKRKSNTPTIRIDDVRVYKSATFDVIVNGEEITVYYQENDTLDVWDIRDEDDDELDIESELGKIVIKKCNEKLKRMSK